MAKSIIGANAADLYCWLRAGPDKDRHKDSIMINDEKPVGGVVFSLIEKEHYQLKIKFIFRKRKLCEKKLQ